MKSPNHTAQNRIAQQRMHTPTPPEVDPDSPMPTIDPDPQPDNDQPTGPSRAPEGDPPAKPPPVQA